MSTVESEVPGRKPGRVEEDAGERERERERGGIYVGGDLIFVY